MTVDMIKTATPTAVFVLDHENEAHRAVRAGLNRASWTTAKGLSQAERDTLRAVVRGERVYVVDVLAAIVSGLSANATRFGQSMARRVGRQPLLDLYGLLPQVETVSPVEQSHRARVEQEQARTITCLKEQSSTRGQRILQQANEIVDLKREVERLRALQPTAADKASADFAFDIMTGEQRQRVSDFRTGYRAAQRG